MNSVWTVRALRGSKWVFVAKFPTRALAVAYLRANIAPDNQLQLIAV